MNRGKPYSVWSLATYATFITYSSIKLAKLLPEFLMIYGVQPSNDQVWILPISASMILAGSAFFCLRCFRFCTKYSGQLKIMTLITML